MTYTTIQIPLELNIRIRQLAEKTSRKLGLPTLSQRKYLEMLILKAEAEEKKKNDK